MTIEFYDPSKISQVGDIDASLRTRANWIPLPEGEYDITPEKWRAAGSKAKFSYSLKVNEDGTGLVHMLPNDPSAGITAFSFTGGEKYTPGGKMIHLPNDQDVAVMAGPGANGIEVFGMVRHVPGESPDIDAPLFLNPTRNKVAEAASRFFDEIKTPITNADQAKELVIDDAIKRVKKLDWAHFGDNLTVDEILEPFSLVALRNSGQDFPITSLVEFKEEDVEILGQLPAQQKMLLQNGIWLATLMDVIHPKYASFMRDWVYLKLPESVAAFNKLDVDEIVNYFAKNDPSYMNAGIRLTKDMAEFEVK